MGARLPKQYLEVLGQAVLCHTLAVFDAMPECRRIVIATDDRDMLAMLLSDPPLRTPVRIVDGGAARQDSVRNALTACGKDRQRIILVHDAARPCIDERSIRAAADAIRLHGAALVAVPVRDTIKQVDSAIVRGTLDRSSLWLAQTPQGARLGTLRDAYDAAASSGLAATDDAALLEGIGVPVHVVEGSPLNFKITTRDDLALAEGILRERAAPRP
jgi:2-C-methyl-D-erythritol 4-phosphate cytidylyltransferase